MALLHDEDYVITHLRAAYLQSFPDGIGNRIINPATHIYYTKLDPANGKSSDTSSGALLGLQAAGAGASAGLSTTTSMATTLVNNSTSSSSGLQETETAPVRAGEPIFASQSVMQLVKPSSPPIPTSTLRDMSALRRRKRTQARGLSLATNDLAATAPGFGFGARGAGEGTDLFDFPQHARRDPRTGKKKKSNSTGATTSSKKKSSKKHSGSSTSSTGASSRQHPRDQQQQLTDIGALQLSPAKSRNGSVSLLSSPPPQSHVNALAQAYTLSQAGIKPRASTIPPDAVTAAQYPYTNTAADTPASPPDGINAANVSLFALDKESNSSTDTLPLLTNITKNARASKEAAAAKKKKRAQSAAAVSLSGSSSQAMALDLSNSSSTSTETPRTVNTQRTDSQFSGSIEENSEGDDTFDGEIKDAIGSFELGDGDSSDSYHDTKTDTEDILNKTQLSSTTRKHKTSTSSEAGEVSGISPTSPNSSTAAAFTAPSSGTNNLSSKYKRLIAALPPGVTLSEQQQNLIVRHHRLRKKLLRLQQQLTPSELTLYRNGELSEAQLREIYMRHKTNRHHHGHHAQNNNAIDDGMSSPPPPAASGLGIQSPLLSPSSAPQNGMSLKHPHQIPRSSTTSNMLALGTSTVTINGTTAASGVSNPAPGLGSRSGSTSDSQKPALGRSLHRQLSIGMSSQPLYATASTSVSSSSLSSIALASTPTTTTFGKSASFSTARPSTPPPPAKPASAPTTPIASSPSSSSSSPSSPTTENTGNNGNGKARKTNVTIGAPTSSAAAALLARTRQTLQQQQLQLQQQRAARLQSQSSASAPLPAAPGSTASSVSSSPKKKHKKKRQQLLMQLQLQQQNQLQLQQRLGLLPPSDVGSLQDPVDPTAATSSGIALANALGYAITPDGIAAAAAAAAATSGVSRKQNPLLYKLTKQSAGSSASLAKQQQQQKPQPPLPSEEKLTAQAKLDIGLGLRSSTKDGLSKVDETAPNAPALELPRGRARNPNRPGADDSSANASLSSSKKSPRKINPFPKMDIAAPPASIKAELNTASETTASSALSKLTSQINEKRATFDDPLEVYVEASGKSELRPLKLKMYMPSSDHPRIPWEVSVRRDVNVASAIGFALYCYNNSIPAPGKPARTPKLPPNMCNANKWTLRIVEEDGEPDEDFPALDRTRLISAFSFDEFALVEATAAQAVENEKATPSARRNKKTEQNGSAANSIAVSTAAAPNKANGINKSSAPLGSKSSEESNEINTTHKAVLNIYQYPYDDMVSSLYWSAEVDLSVTVGEVLFQVCIDKSLDRTQYVLKQVARRTVLPMNSTFSDISANQSDESDDDSDFEDEFTNEFDDESLGNGGLLMSDVMALNSSPIESRNHNNKASNEKSRKRRAAKEAANNDKIVAHQRRRPVLGNFEITPKRIVTALNGYREGGEVLRAVAGEHIVPLSTSPEYTRTLHGFDSAVIIEEDVHRHGGAGNRNSLYTRRTSGTSFYHRNSSDNGPGSGRPSISAGTGTTGSVIDEHSTTSGAGNAMPGTNDGKTSNAGGTAAATGNNSNALVPTATKDSGASGTTNTSTTSNAATRSTSTTNIASGINMDSNAQALGFINTSSSAALAASARQRLRASIVPKSTSGAGGGRSSRPTSGLSTSFTNDLYGAVGGFYRYKVWRRQPMSFIARHERVLTIDGDYIHLVPAEDPAWYDSLKTSSFHVSQMVKCKLSRKVPTNFKIVITKNSGSKRYDLEAPSKEVAEEIINRLKNVFTRYLLKTGSSVGVGSIGHNGGPPGSFSGQDLLSGTASLTVNHGGLLTAAPGAAAGFVALGGAPGAIVSGHIGGVGAGDLAGGIKGPGA